MSFISEQTKQKIKAAFADIKPMYDRLSEQSWNDYVNSLPYGQAIPPKGRFYDSARKDQFTAFVTQQRNKALEALSVYRTNIDNAMSIAPTDEALRAVQAFSLRNPDSMTREEYSAEVGRLMTRYGANYSIYMGLYDMAAKAGIHGFNKHPLAAEAENIDHAKELVTRSFNGVDMTYHDAPSDGQKAMFDYSLDQCLPDE